MKGCLVTGGTRGPKLLFITLLVRMLLSMPIVIIADALAAKPDKQVMRTLFKAVSGGSAAALRPRFCSHIIHNDSSARNLSALARQLSPWRDLPERCHV